MSLPGINNVRIYAKFDEAPDILFLSNFVGFTAINAARGKLFFYSIRGALRCKMSGRLLYNMLTCEGSLEIDEKLAQS